MATKPPNIAAHAAAAYLGLSRHTIRKYVQRGLIAAYGSIGRSYVFSRTRPITITANRTKITNKIKPSLNQPQKKDSGPGTELQKILKLLGIDPKISCGCESIKNKMNRWGVEGCQEAANFEWIISQMVANAAEYSWYEKVQAAMAAAVSTIAIRINPLDVYGSLVREAIRRTQTDEN